MLQGTAVLGERAAVKMVPGRKTDVRDCEWLAQLLECGLLRGSFVPPQAVRDLRDLTRYRKVLIRERGDHVNRVEKTLELANIKLGCVVTDLMGKTGRAILEALIAGVEDPDALAALAQGSLQKERAELREAVVGRMTPHYAFLLQQQLALIDALGACCHGNNASAGKRRPTTTGKGATWLRATLQEAAWAAVKTKQSYYAALYHRLKVRRGTKKAIVAVQHAMLVALWHMLTHRVPHRDFGRDYFDRRNQARMRRHHVRRLQQLGYQVLLVEEGLTGFKFHRKSILRFT